MFSVSFKCEDGKWVREKPVGAAAAFVCSPLCPPLLLNPSAYTVKSIAAAPTDVAEGDEEEKRHDVISGSGRYRHDHQRILRCHHRHSGGYRYR